MNYDIHKIGGIILKDKKLLVTRSKGKDVFVAPGGKVEKNETAEEALTRELKEEISIEIKKDTLKEFGTFYAPAAGKEDSMLRMDVIIVKDWEGEIAPASEIEEIIWIDSNYPKDIKIGSIFEHEVIPRLKEGNLIT